MPGQPFTWPRTLRRLYRMKTGTGLLLALPGLLLALWYVWTAWASLQLYSASEHVAVDLPLFQARLHDLALQQLQRLHPLRAQAAEDLPFVEISVKPERLPELLKRDRPFLPAKLEAGKTRYKHAEVRLRGQKVWHLASAKKSLRVRLEAGDLLLGNRSFNLSNPSEPFPIAEKIILDLARELGLMTSDTDFVRVSFNGLELGVYAYGTPLDEAIVRRAHRIPADLYAPDQDAGWSSAARWEQISAYNPKQTERTDLTRLLGQLARPSEFADFAARELDLKAFATLGALQLLFGGDADQAQHYGLYHDPYRGKWEPVLDEFEGLRHVQDTASPDPLFKRLAELPAYRHQRDRIAKDLLEQQASLAAIRARGEALLARLEPALVQDPYWQANRQLPEINGLYHHLLRPMSPATLELAFADSLETYARRLARLQATLPVQPPAAATAQPTSTVTLGPGSVAIEGTRVFAAGQRVKVAPGTRLSMGPNASLIFYGPVDFAGTAAAPILIRPAGTRRWGGIAIQGPASAGSSLSHVDIAGGTMPQLTGLHYSGMVNLHDTRDLSVSNSRFADNQGSDDLIHTVYVQNLQAKNNRIDSAFSDAWDLEFSQARIEGLKVVGSGDDGLDLMGTELELTHSVLLDSLGNGISAGEESRVRVKDSLIADSRVGTLAKNASRVSFSHSLLYRDRIGLRLEQKALYYAAQSSIDGKGLAIASAQTPISLDKEAEHAKSPRPVFTSDYRAQPALDRLRKDLGLTGWQALDNWIRRTREASR